MNSLSRCYALLFFLLGSGALFAKTSKQADIATAVAESKIMTKFSALIKASGQEEFLQSRGPFTVFAPVDSAFARMTPEQFQTFLSPLNQREMQRVLLFHIVNGRRLSGAELVTLSILSSEGAALVLKKNKLGAVTVEHAKILRTDIRCKNGVIHQIDTLLLPPGPVIPPEEPPKALAVEPAAPASEGTNAAPPLTVETNAVSMESNAVPTSPVVQEAPSTKTP